MKKRRNKWVLDEAAYNEIEETYAQGCETMVDLCKVIGVPYETFNGWLNKSNLGDDVKRQLSQAIKRGEERRPQNLLKLADLGMRKLLAGYEYEEATKEVTKTAMGTTVKTKTVKKTVPPNATMVIFTKVNKDPDNWQSINKVDVNTNTTNTTKFEVKLDE